MTAAPEPGAQDLVKVIAEALLAEYEVDAGEGCDGGPVPYVEGQPYDMADTLLVAFRAAGLAVMELLEPHAEDVTSTGTRRALFGPIFARVDADGAWTLSSGSTVTDEQVRATAAGLLAGLAWVQRLRAEHQPLEHDGAGPPICEPCSADCPACAAGRQGGEPR